MARKSEPGIRYFPLDSNHVSNNKIKLLVNEFDSHGYWIYQCILSEAYSKKGYYVDFSDPDVLILFASDVCKKPVSLVKDVIAGCVRRGLFESAIFDTYKVLTSDRIQINYLEAKKELRKKGNVLKLISEYWVIDVEKSTTLKFFSIIGNSSREELEKIGEELEKIGEDREQRRGEENKSRIEEKREGQKPSTFVPPSQLDLENFFSEEKQLSASGWALKKCKTEAEKFINKYTSVGWKIGRGQILMQDWKSAALNWIESEKEWSAKNPSSAVNTPSVPYQVGRTQVSTPTAEPSEQQKKQIAIQAITNSFDDFIATGHYEDFGNAIYRAFTVTLSNQKFNEFIENRDEYYKNRGLDRLKNRQSKTIDMKSGILKAIEDNALSDVDTDQKAIVEGRKEAIRDFFIHLVDEKISINEILN